MCWRKSMGEQLRVWLDDVRPMPDDFDCHVRTAQDAIALLKAGRVGCISLDHDLGEGDVGTGYDVASFIEECAFNGIRPPQCQIHSANPVGVQNMRRAIDSAWRLFFATQEDGNE